LEEALELLSDRILNDELCEINFENWYFHRAYAREIDHVILLFGFQA